METLSPRRSEKSNNSVLSPLNALYAITCEDKYTFLKRHSKSFSRSPFHLPLPIM